MSDSGAFTFLKRGDGMKKYSKIQYPVYSRSSNNHATVIPNELQRDKPDGITDSPLQESTSTELIPSVTASPSTSCLQAKESIEVKQFELLEKLAQELSLSDSSAYLRLLNEVCVAGGTEQKCAEAKAEFPFGFIRTSPSLSSPEGNVNVPTAQPLSGQDSAEEAVPLSKQPLGSGTSQSSPVSSCGGSSVALEKRLVCMVEQLEKDAREVENAQAILSKKSTLLESERLQLEKEKADFEKEKEEQMRSLSSERQFLRQQQKANRKKESDVIAVLRQQICDLQNEICDKEARCSGMRSRIRTLESELNTCKDDLVQCREKYRHLEESNVRLDQENAQLRLKLNSARNGGPPLDTEASALLIRDKIAGIQRSSTAKKTNAKACGDKSVQFLLPEQEPARFVRTENRAIQTDLESEREVPVVIPSVVAHQTFSVPQNPTLEKLAHPAKIFERVRADGSAESVYANGTVQEVSPDGNTVTYHYSNGDSRRLLSDGSEVYLFSSKGLVQKRDPSGLLKLKHSDGHTEVHHVDGRIELEFPEDGSFMTVFPDGRRRKRFADGTTAEESLDGTEVFCFTDGSKETRHKNYMRRDFPNGDVRFKHADGTEETHYASGRLRVKDATGKVIRDEVVTRK